MFKVEKSVDIGASSGQVNGYRDLNVVKPMFMENVGSSGGLNCVAHNVLAASSRWTQESKEALSIGIGAQSGETH